MQEKYKVREWNKRPKEIAYLYNPAFCGQILYRAIQGYQNNFPYMPYSLIFFVLPLILYNETFEDFSLKKKHLSSWFQRKPELLNDFIDRVKNFELITRESILFLAKFDLISFEKDGFVLKSLSTKRVKLKEKELLNYFNKAEKIGTFLANAGEPSNVYMILGVKP